MDLSLRWMTLRLHYLERCSEKIRPEQFGLLKKCPGSLILQARRVALFV